MSGKHVEDARAAVRKEWGEYVRETGVVTFSSSQYSEIESLLEDAVDAGDAAAFRGLNLHQINDELRRRFPNPPPDAKGTPYRIIAWSYDVEDLRVIAVPDGKLHLSNWRQWPSGFLGATECGVLIKQHYLINEEIPTRWANPVCQLCENWLESRHHRKNRDEENQILRDAREAAKADREAMLDEYDDPDALFPEGHGFVHM